MNPGILCCQGDAVPLLLMNSKSGPQEQVQQVSGGGTMQDLLLKF